MRATPSAGSSLIAQAHPQGDLTGFDSTPCRRGAAAWLELSNNSGTDVRSAYLRLAVGSMAELSQLAKESRATNRCCGAIRPHAISPS